MTPREADAYAANVVAALVTAAAHARWPSGQLLVDLEERVIRERLAPHLLAALACREQPAGPTGTPLVAGGPR